MHAAPPVRMSLSADPVVDGFIVVCATAAAASLAAWLSLQLQLAAGVIVVVVSVAALSTLGLTTWTARSAMRRDKVLAWDGAAWHLTCERLPAGGSLQSASGDLQVMMDLGGWVLLRFTPTTHGSPHSWMAASRRQAGVAWPKWRAAVLAPRAGRQTLTSGDAS